MVEPTPAYLLKDGKKKKLLAGEYLRKKAWQAAHKETVAEKWSDNDDLPIPVRREVVTGARKRYYKRVSPENIEQVLFLYTVLGWSWTEISKETGHTPSTVKRITTDVDAVRAVRPKRRFF